MTTVSAGDSTLSRCEMMEDHHLLMSTLDGAVTLVQVYNVAIAITDYLNLDVSRPFNELLQKQRTVAECRLRLGPRSLKCFIDLLLQYHCQHEFVWLLKHEYSL